MGRSVFSQPTDFSQVDSFSGDGIIATTYEDDYFVRGNGILINNVITLAGTTTINFLIDFSGLDAGKSFFITPFKLASSEEEVQITLYEDTDYSGGTGVTLINPNRTSAITPQTVITTGATGTTEGTQLTIHSAFGVSGFLGLSSPGSSASRPAILDTSVKYLITIENLGVGSTRVEYDFVFFEI